MFIEDQWEIENYTDYLNKARRRNGTNTPTCKYNCTGYALGLFNWYMPWSETDLDNPHYRANQSDYIDEQVAYMVNELKGLVRVIEDESEIEEHEYLVLYRTAKNDFHFVKKFSDGVYFHKRGGTPCIEEMSKEEVYGPAWCGRYDSKIVKLAVRG